MRTGGSRFSYTWRYVSVITSLNIVSGVTRASFALKYRDEIGVSQGVTLVTNFVCVCV